MSTMPEGPEPMARIDLDARHRIQVAREFVARNLRTDHSLEVRETVLLLASELVTNAIRHARPPWSLGVDVDAHRVRVEVADGSPEHPVAVAPRAPGAGGFGIAIVQRASTAWGVEPAPPGKIVWFEVATP